MTCQRLMRVDLRVAGLDTEEPLRAGPRCHDTLHPWPDVDMKTMTINPSIIGTVLGIYTGTIILSAVLALIII